MDKPIHLKMNRDKAKNIGAFPSKELAERSKPGNTLVCVNTTEVYTRTNDPDQFKYSTGMYLKIPEDPQTLELCGEIKDITSEIKELENRIKELEAEKQSKQKVLQDTFVFGDNKSHMVLWIRRDVGDQVTAEDLGIQDGHKLVKLGIRADGREGHSQALWVAIVEVPGVVSKTVENKYCKTRFEYNSRKAYDAAPIEKTGFRLNSFDESMSKVIM